MSRRRKRNGSGERFVMLPHYMLRTLAWLTLSPNAKAVLLHLWQRHNGSNNGDIVYAVREAEAIGLSKDQASRALIELIKRGFLRVARNSAFVMKTKEARTWTLTAEAVGSAPPTKDFIYWSQAHQRDCHGADESKTRSHQRDRGSHQRDREAAKAIILPISVSPARPSDPKSTRSRSHQRDTSNIPCVPVRFGDAAKAQRTVRDHAPAEVRGGLTANESEAAAHAERRTSDNFDEDGGHGLTRLGEVLDTVLAAARR